MCPIHHPKKKEKRGEQRLRLTTFRVRVFVWETVADEEPRDGFCFLSEFSPSGAGLYLGESIPPASFVRVAFEDREANAYRATVVWSNRFSLRQRFVGHEALSFRVGVKFQFGSEAERQRYLKYISELKARAELIDAGMKF